MPAVLLDWWCCTDTSQMETGVQHVNLNKENREREHQYISCAAGAMRSHVYLETVRLNLQGVAAAVAPYASFLDRVGRHVDIHFLNTLVGMMFPR